MLFRTLFLAVSIVGWAATASFEDVNIEEYKNDPERLQEFVDCCLHTEPCNDIDGRIEERIPDILATKCGNCTMKEKSILRDLSWLVITKKTKYLPALLEEYDAKETAANLLDSLITVPSLANLPAVSSRLLQKFLEYLNNGISYLHSVVDSE